MRRVNRRNTNKNKKKGFVLVYAVMILCVTVMSVSNTPANRGYMPFYAYALAEESVLIPEEPGAETESVGETETELPSDAPLNEDPLNEEPLNEESLSEGSLNEEPLSEAPLNEEALNEEPLNEESSNEEPSNEEPRNPETANNEEELNIEVVPAAEVTEAPEEIEPAAEVTETPEEIEPAAEVTEAPEEIEPAAEVTEAPEEIEPAAEATEAPEEIEPAAEVTEAPEEIDPAAENTEAPEEIEPAAEVTEAPEEIEPAAEVTEAPEEIEPAEENTEAPEEIEPAAEATEAPEEIDPAEEITEEPAEESAEEAIAETAEGTETETEVETTEEPDETAELETEETVEETGTPEAEMPIEETAAPDSDVEEPTEEPDPTPASRPMMMLAAPPSPTPTSTPAPEYLSDAEIATQSIQAAINAALETAGTTERATIQIKAGNYEADIDIKLENRPANFILELVAEDAGVDYLKGLGSVNFAGNIRIENVDVLLAGIYLALDKKISITDSHTQILGTAQDDTVNVELKYNGSVDIDTGAGDDDININVTTDAASLTISAGAGEDTVEINKGGSNGDGEFRDDNTAMIDTGAGADSVTIDVGVADTYKEVVIENKNKAETGSNAVRFTGTLDNKSKSKGAAARGNEKELIFRNARGNTFTVKNMSPKAIHYTDALQNKPSVMLDAGNLQSVGGVYTFDGTAEPFTDYVLKIDPDTLAELAVKGGGLLSRLVIDARQFASFASYDTVKVHNVKAPEMNIGIYGSEIEVDGTVYGSNINIEASDGTNQKRSTDGGTIGSAMGDFFASLQNVSHSAKVTVTEDAMIAAREGLNISASVSQKLGLTALGVLNNSLGAVINGLGVVDVKVGKATVDIAGKLRAGYDAEADQYGAGSIRIDAKVLAPLAQSVDREASSGSESGPAGQTDSVVPLSVFVAVEDAEINIRRGAELIAHDSVVAHARSAVTSDTRASTQSYLPLVLNTAILVNDSHVKVDGASITGMQGNVNLAAKGYLRSDIIASKGASDQSVSGGFFGISVGVQDVTADLAEGTEIIAGGDVRVASRADADVRSAAVAAYATASAKKKTNTTSNDITIILSKIWASVDEKLKLSDKLTSKALDVIVGLFSSESREVKVSDSSTVEGYGTASVKKNKADVGGTVTLNVLPKDGRDVESVRYRYLEPGASEYKYAGVDLAKAKKSDTEYEFEMPDSDIVVFVTYQSAPGKTYPANGGNNDPFAHGNNGEIEMTDLSGIVDGATEAAAEDTATAGSNGIATENALAEDALTVTFGPFTEEDHGAILTAADDGTGKPLSKLDAGSSAELTVNPAKGYALKKETLAMQYTRTDGAVVRVFLEADSNGKYFLVMPTDAKEDTAITVTAEFEASEEEPRKQTASAQAVGALATGVVENRNDTIIDLGAGKIVAGGKVEFLADGSTVNDVYADASRLTKSTTEAAKNAAVAEENARYYTAYAEGGVFAVKVKDVKGGTVESALADGVITFTADSTDAETTPTCTVFYTNDLGESQTLLLERGADGKFLLNLKELHVKGGTNVEVGFDFPDSTDTSTAEAVFVEDCDHSVQLTAKGYGKIEQKEYGYDGKYDLNFKPGLGYKVKSITVGYKDLNGKLRSIPVTVIADQMNYVLSVNDLPDGCQPGQPITVTAQFDAYNRTIEAPKEADVANGKLTVDRLEAKAGDAVTGEITPEDGYKASEVAYVYTDENGLTQVEYADIEDGKYTFTMPAMKFGPAYKVEIKTTFVKKDVEIIVDGTGFTAAQSRADRKEATALAAADPDMKLTDVVIKAFDASGAELNGVTVEYKDGKLTIPDNEKIASVRVSANTAEKALSVNASQPDEKQGSLTVSAKRAEPGETVSVTFAPEKGYTVKDGSVKAVITGGIETTVKAVRAEDGSYSFMIPKDCASGSVEILYELTEGTETKNTAGLYVGTGIAVAVTGGDNNVRIRSGSVTAGKDFTVQALTGSSVSGAVAKSGYSEAKVGIGGAIAVNIGGYTTNALIHNPSVINVNGGAVKIKTVTKVNFTTAGDSSVKTDKANTGVGTGIAVAVNSSDAYAAVQDQTAMTIGRAVTAIDITADQKLTDTVTAKAGSAGNTAVTPSVAVDIFASDTVAALGAILGEDIDISRDSGATLSLAAINAANKATHTLTADASAAGKGVGLGGSFGIAVVTDQVRAALQKSLKANGIYVGSDAQSTVQMTINAGAEGGVEGSKKQDGSQGSADAKADQLTKNAASLSSGRNSNTGALKIGDKLNGRQKAQTGEGSVAGAAALALNIFDNASTAELGNGTYEAHGLADYVEDPIKTLMIKRDLNGTIRVKSINRTEAQIKANASATKSTYGVGVAVGVNIVDLTNTAMITEAGIIADTLDVQAVQPTVKIAEITNSSTPNEIKETVTGAVKVAVTRIMDSLGIHKILQSDVIETLVSDLAGEFANSFMTESGVDKIFTVTSIEDQVKQNYEDLKAGLTDEVLAVIRLVMIDQLGEEKGGKAYTAVRNDLKKQIDAVSGGFNLNLDSDEIRGYRNDLIAGLVTFVAEGLVTGEAKTETLSKPLFDVIYKAFSQVYAGKEFTENIRKALTGYDPSLSGIAGSILKAFKDRFPDMVADCVVTMTRPVELPKLLAYLNSGMKETLQKNIQNALAKASVKVTESQIRNLDEKYDLLLKAENVAEMNVLKTEAISGAGAADLGIAGSVAVLVLNENTYAGVGNTGTMPVEIGDDMTVNAANTHRITTIASASADGSGDANANDEASAGANDAGSGKTGELKLEGDYNYITIAGGPGYTVEVEPGTTKAKIIAEDGYTVPFTVPYTYTDKDGNEKQSAIMIGEGNTFTLPAKKSEMPEDGVITIKPVMTEVLKTVADPLISGSDPASGAEAAVRLPDRDGADVSKARPGELVEISTAKVAGKHVGKVSYTYEFVNEAGVTETKTETVGATAYTNDEEIAYSFRMPDGNITAINVYYEDGDDTTGTTNSKGESVGVGASFAMVYGNTATEASLENKNNITVGGNLSVMANLDSKLKTASVAGTDPMALKKQEKVTGISVDASVALSLLDSSAKTVFVVGDTASVTGNMTADAEEKSLNVTQASGFAVGKATAVGAAAAINVGENAAETTVSGGLLKVGKETAIKSGEYSEDTVRATATALGADIQRVLNKYSDKLEATQKNINGLLDGSIFKTGADQNKAKQNENNATASIINGKLNASAKDSQASANNNNSVSTNILITQNASTSGSTDADKAAASAAGQTNGAAAGLPEGASVTGGNVKESKFQVAAAAAVNVAEHNAKTRTDIRLIHENDVLIASSSITNTRTLGTAAAISGAVGANSISAGVAISVNNSGADTEINGSLTGETGNVTVSSDISQNLTDSYAGRLAVQALSGAVSGKDSSVSIAGAVTVLVSEAKARTRINAAMVNGDQVSIIANDKSRLTSRAGGLSLSKGTTVGVGAAFSSVFSNDTVKTEIADGTEIKAKNAEIAARKIEVTHADYQSGLEMRTIVTDSSRLTPEARKNVETGIIDLHKATGEKTYSLDINLSTDKLISVMDLANFLSGVNYYSEAIAGSVITGESTANVAGSFAVTYTDNTVRTLIGKGVKINTAANAAVEAVNDNSYRTIAGAVSAGASKAGVGLTLGYLQNNDTVEAVLGQTAAVSAGEDYLQRVSRKVDAGVFTAAASVGTGKAVANAGGAINVILLDGSAENIVDSYAKVSALGALKQETVSDLDLLLVSADAQATGGKVAAGGTVATVINNNRTINDIRTSAKLDSVADLELNVAEKAQMISAIASVSAARGKVGAAGSVNILVTSSENAVNIGEDVSVESSKGNLIIAADSDTWLLNAGLAAAGSTGVSVGGAVAAEVLSRKALVNVASYARLRAGENLEVRSAIKDFNIMAQLSGSLSTGTAGVSGTIPAIISGNTGRVEIGQCAELVSGKAMDINAHYSARIYGVAGSLAASAGTAAVGATVQTVVLKNTIETLLRKDSRITAGGGVSSRGRKGLYIGADADETAVFVAIGGAGANAAAISGAVNTLVVTDAVRTSVTGNIIRQSAADQLTVEATGNTHAVNVSGGLGVAGTAAVGASVVTQILDKTVETIVSNSRLSTGGDMALQTRAQDDLELIAVNAGIAGSAAVETGAVINIYENDVTVAASSSELVAENTLSVTADKTVNTDTTAVAVAGSGTAAVSPVAAVTVLGGKTNVALDQNQIRVYNGAMTARAKTAVAADPTVAGAGLAGAVSVSGAVSVLVSQAETSAKVLMGRSDMIRAAEITVDASDSFTSEGMSGVLAGSGTAAVAVNALVTVLKNTVRSEIAAPAGRNDSLQATDGNINLTAKSVRDVTNIGSSLGVAGTAGVSVAVMVLSSGGKITQDAADTLANGGSGNAVTFDSNAFIQDAFVRGGNKFTAGYEVNARTVTREALAGDGVKAADMKLGTRVDGKGSFDAVKGYRDTDANYESGSVESRSFHARSEQLDNASKLGTVSETAREDSVAAILNAGVIAGKDINVKAENTTLVDSVTAALGAGGMAGIGFGVNVAVLNSAVQAVAEKDVVLKADGNINLYAYSGSEEIRDASDTNSVTGQLNSLLYNSELNRSGRSVRVISAAAAAGFTGVAVPVAVLRMNNATSAKMLANAQSARMVSIESVTDYPLAMAATVALSAGVVGIGGSVAVTTAEGTSEALYDLNDTVYNANGASIYISNVSRIDATALAMAGGGGGTALNAGIAVAANRMKSAATLTGGEIIGAGNVSVSSTADTTAHAYTRSVGTGVVSGSLSGAVSVVSPENISRIATELNGVSMMSITANSTSSSKAKALTSGIGFGEINGAILLSFNDSVNKALLDRVNVQNATIMRINSSMNATADTDSTATSAGAIAVGLNISYTDMHAENAAIVELASTTIGAEQMDLKASLTSLSTASSVVAALGGLSAGFNTAIVDARGSNTALLRDLTGKTSEVSVKRVNIAVDGTSKANAQMRSRILSLADAGASFALALQRTEQTSGVKAANSNLKNVTQLNITSALNKNVTDAVLAKIISNDSAIMKLNASVAEAYGRSINRALLTAYNVQADGTAVNVNASGNSGAKANVTNGSNSAIAATVFQNLAYAQDVIEAKVTGLNLLAASSLNVGVDYGFAAESILQPTVGSVSLASVTSNRATARVSSKALASVSGNRTLQLSTGALNITANGGISAKSEVQISSGKINATGIHLATNTAASDITANVGAELANNQSVKTAAESAISSILNDLTSSATVYGYNSKAKVSFINGDLHTASANMHAVNTVTLSDSTLKSGSLTVRAENGKATSTANTLNDTSSVSVSFASVGSMKALSGINSSAAVNIAGMNVQTGNVDISAFADVTSGAIGTAPKKTSAIAYGGSYMTSTIGSEKDRQAVAIRMTDSTITANGDFTVKAANTGSISSELRNNKSLSLAQVNKGDISTKSYYATDIDFADSTTVSANNILIDLYDAEKAESVANSGKSLSGLDLSSVYGNNRVNVIDTIHLGKQTVLDAKQALKIVADNAATVTTETSSSSKAILASGNTVQAASTLSRALTFNADEGSILTADYGDMTIDIRSGLNDVINSVTYAEAVGGFTSFGKSSATANVTSTADVVLNKATLKNDFGTMTINALTGSNGKTSASAQGGGFVAEPTASAYVKLTGRSKIQAIGSELTAKYLNLLADIPTADLLATGSGKASGAGAYVNTWGTVELAVDSMIDLDQSVLTGHEEMMLFSNANPQGNLKANSGGRTSGAYASGESAAKVDGHVIGTVNVTDSHLKGTGILVARGALEQSKVIRDASMTKKGLFGSPDKNKKGTVKTENGSENITFNGSKISLGGGVAGIHVEVYNENGATLTRSYGLSGRRGGRLLADGKVQITDLASFEAGQLTVLDGGRITDMHGTEILHPDAVPSMTVTNLSDRDIILSKVLESSGFMPEHMRILGAKNYNEKRDTDKSSLKLDVTTTKGKDVYLGDIIDMPSAVASFIWKGARGSLYTLNGSEGEILNFMKYGEDLEEQGGTAPKLFIKQLVTQNGKDLGKVGTPVVALLFGDSTSGLLQLENDNIDLEITPATEMISDSATITDSELPRNFSAYPTARSTLGKVKANGHCNINLNNAVVYLHTKDPIQVYDVPDTIRYTDVAHTLAELFATYGKDLIETQYNETSNNNWYLNKAAGAVFLTTDKDRTILGDVVLATYDAYYQGMDENGLAMYELPDGTVLWYDNQGKLVRMQLLQTMTDGSVQGVLYELGDISVSRDNAYIYNGYSHFSGSVEGVGTFNLAVPMKTFDNPFSEANYTLTLDPDITYVTDMKNVNSLFACDMLSQGLAQIAYRDDEGNYTYSNVFDRHENDRHESDYTTVCKTYFGVTEQEAISALASDDWNPVYVWFEKDNIPDPSNLRKTGEGETIHYTIDSSLIRIDRDIYPSDASSTDNKYVFVLDADENGGNRTVMEFRRSGSGFDVYYQGQQVGQYDPSKADNRAAIPGGDLFTEVPYAIKMVNNQPVLYMMDMEADKYVSGSIKLEQDPETKKYVLYLMDPGSDLNADGNNATITVKTAASSSEKPVVLSLNDVHTERNVINKYLQNEVNLTAEIAARIDNRGAVGANLSDLAYYKPGVTSPVVSRINSVGMSNFLAENVALGNDINSNPWAGANADDRYFGNWNRQISNMYAASTPNGKVPYYWMDSGTKVYDTLVADIYANSYKGFSLQGNMLGAYNYVQNGVSTPLTVTVDDSGKMTFMKSGEVVAERTVGADGTVYITADGVKVGSDRSYDVIDAKQQKLFTRVLLDNPRTTNVVVQAESITADTVYLKTTNAFITGATLPNKDAAHIRANEVTLICNGIVDRNHQILTVGSLDKNRDFLRMNVSATENIKLRSLASNNFLGSVRGQNLELEFDGSVFGGTACAIQAKNMILTAKSIGTGNNALRINVSGRLNVNGGELGKGTNNVWYTNLYRDPNYKPASDLRNDRRMEDLLPIYELNELENLFLTAVKVLFRNLDTTRIKNDRIKETVGLYEGTELVALKKLAEHNSTLNKLLTFIYVADLAETEDGLTGTAMLADAIHDKAGAKEGEMLYYIYFHHGKMTVGSANVEEGLFTFAFEGCAEDYVGNNGYIPFVMADGTTLETACEVLGAYMEGLD